MKAALVTPQTLCRTPSKTLWVMATARPEFWQAETRTSPHIIMISIARSALEASIHQIPSARTTCLVRIIRPCAGRSRIKTQNERANIGWPLSSTVG